MSEKKKHQSIGEEEFRCLDFAYHGTLVSGKQQEIDVFRPIEPGDGPEIEIRVTMALEIGAMQYAGISLSDHRGAPVIMTGAKGGKVNTEMAEVAIWEAIEYDDRAMDYSYGRRAIGEGMKPGTYLLAVSSMDAAPDPA